jgi:hypothetical protein
MAKLKLPIRFLFQIQQVQAPEYRRHGPLVQTQTMQNNTLKEQPPTSAYHAFITP